MDNEDFDIYKFCREPQSPVGPYSGNPRDFAEERTRPETPQYDPLEIWLDEPDAEYNDPDFEHFVDFRVKTWMERSDGKVTDINLWCGGQSHKDLAWRWRYGQTKQKALTTFRKAVRHADMFPFYTFQCSQPTLLEWVRDLDPELFADLQRVVEANQFDLVGGCMNECDCRMPSGEAFVRQRLYGQLYYLEHFGRLSDVEWAPDTFGFANTLPQLVLKSGSRCFYTTKMGNNDTSPFPFTYFWWEGPDGSRLLFYYCAHGFNILNLFADREASLHPLKSGKTLRATCESPDPMHAPELADEFFDDLAVFVGAGDGKSGPLGQEVAEFRKYVDRGFFEGWTTAHEHMARVAAIGDRLPVWVDEIYYEYHRGTLTTQHLVKRMNRRLENDIQALENLATVAHLAAGPDIEYPHEGFTQAWHATLLVQMHDVLPGSSVPEVYDDCHDYWEKVAAYLAETRDQLMREWASHVGTAGDPEVQEETRDARVLVFNSLGFPTRIHLVEVPWPPDRPVPTHAVSISTGTRTPVVVWDADDPRVDTLDRKPRRLAFQAPAPLPALGTAGFALQGPASALDSSLGDAGEFYYQDDPDACVLVNAHLRVRVDRETNRIALYRRNPAKKKWDLLVGKGDLRLFADRTPKEQCWNIQPDYRAHERTIPPGEVALKVKPKNGVYGEIRVRREVGDSHLELTIRLLRDSPLVHVELLADWHETDATMRFEFTHETRAEASVAESPYGWCRRKTRPTGQHDVGRWEMYGQAWADVSAPEGGWGVAVLNEGKYGFDARDDRLGLTLLRGPQYPEPDTNAWIRDERKRREAAGKGAPPQFADQGVSVIRFGLLIHEGSAPTNPAINAIAHEFNRPPLVLGPGENRLTLGDPADPDKIPANEPLVTLSSPTVELTALKRAERDPDTFVARLVEMGGMPETSLEVTFHESVSRRIQDIHEADLLERPGEITAAGVTWTRLASGQVKCELTIRACEVVTLLISI